MTRSDSAVSPVVTVAAPALLIVAIDPPASDGTPALQLAASVQLPVAGLIQFVGVCAEATRAPASPAIAAAATTAFRRMDRPIRRFTLSLIARPPLCSLIGCGGT